VGGAVMGSSTAYHLKTLEPAIKVVVVERDPTYRQSSTVLSDGNVRIQFNLEENIRMSRYGLEVLEDFAQQMAVGDWRPDPAVRHQGNLFLTDAEHLGEAQTGFARQLSLGCEVEWLEAPAIGARFRAYQGSGYEAGTLSPRDGSVDPTAVLQGYVRKSAVLGVEFTTGEAAAITTQDGAVTGVSLSGGEHLPAPVVVNAAGAWCAPLAATAHVDLPVIPVMRSVYVVETSLDNSRLPSVFLPSGLYVIPEMAGRFLVGWSQPDDPIGYDFTFGRAKFYERIWPELGTRLPAFEALHLVGGWVGLYEVNTLDGNAILGEWPELPGLYLANGHSGHGFQHCHAVGRHLAELILGRPPSLDLTRLGPQRILDRQPVFEHAGRII
ncbi:MAG TPA: FAD-dependent oxidoreductase, partial [Acidimicrobiia bacterium]|nr:FAD-dependent oxidoreductase [Acidimicrobiia bacterium]